MNTPLTGRIDASPRAVLDVQILRPQFAHEAAHLLPHYIAAERALLDEYHRMDVLSETDCADLHTALAAIGAAGISPDAAANFSDVAFAIETGVTSRLGRTIAGWHVDRSRNDLQATAQRMYARERIDTISASVAGLAAVTLDRAQEYITDPMPGQTHLQAAQVISPAFFLTALAEELLDTLDALAGARDLVDRCPLGAGAMAGGDLAWDRRKLATALGFARPARHALGAVASRHWVLSLTAALSNFGVTLSRFTTDLMGWGSGPVGYLWLPDDLAGISSAMPQKRNYPVLERIRGRSAHLTSLYLDAALGQRNTTYTNLVEVSKEASALLPTALDAAESVLALTTTVISSFRLDTERAAADAGAEFLGAFSLANRLTLDHGIGWREAQVISGRYIVAALEQGVAPGRAGVSLLSDALAGTGHPLPHGVLEPLLDNAFDPVAALAAKVTAGGTSPVRVLELIESIRHDLADRTTPGGGPS